MVRHWPLTICLWSVQCYRKVVRNTTQLTHWIPLNSRNLNSGIPTTSRILLSDLNSPLEYIRANASCDFEPAPDMGSISGIDCSAQGWKQFRETSTCVGQLICPEWHVSSLNKCNSIQPLSSAKVLLWNMSTLCMNSVRTVVICFEPLILVLFMCMMVIFALGSICFSIMIFTLISHWLNTLYVMRSISSSINTAMLIESWSV